MAKSLAALHDARLDGEVRSKRDEEAFVRARTKPKRDALADDDAAVFDLRRTVRTRRSLATCSQCDQPFHLNPRNDLPGKDCGAVWINEQYLGSRVRMPALPGWSGRDLPDARATHFASAARTAPLSQEALISSEPTSRRRRHRRRPDSAAAERMTMSRASPTLAVADISSGVRIRRRRVHDELASVRARAQRHTLPRLVGCRCAGPRPHLRPRK